MQQMGLLVQIVPIPQNLQKVVLEREKNWLDLK